VNSTRGASAPDGNEVENGGTSELDAYASAPDEKIESRQVGGPAPSMPRNVALIAATGCDVGVP
jgi:hypothetical protein